MPPIKAPLHGCVRGRCSPPAQPGCSGLSGKI